MGSRVLWHLHSVTTPLHFSSKPWSSSYPRSLDLSPDQPLLPVMSNQDQFRKHSEIDTVLQWECVQVKCTHLQLREAPFCSFFVHSVCTSDRLLAVTTKLLYSFRFILKCTRLQRSLENHHWRNSLSNADLKPRKPVTITIHELASKFTCRLSSPSSHTILHIIYTSLWRTINFHNKVGPSSNRFTVPRHHLLPLTLNPKQSHKLGRWRQTFSLLKIG